MIETERLIIRAWRDDDRTAYAAMGQDPAVMRFLGPLESREQTDAAIDRMMAIEAAHGHCFWAVERRADAAFLGFCGLLPGKEPLVGLIEIGWRLGSGYWRQGYAREAAGACLDWGWDNLPNPSIHAITVAANMASWGLMERIGMQRLAEQDFDHPGVPDGSPLKRHIMYRIDRPVHAR